MERTFTFGQALRWILSTLLFAVLVGCSSLEGQSYTYGEKGANGTLSGVPFTLNKPVPSVTHTVAADSGKEAYQVTFNYVADSSKRYTLQIKPSMLASVDFSMTFDAGGSLTEASAKAADQTGALIATVGKLAVLAAADTKSEDGNLLLTTIALGDKFASRRPDVAVWRGISAEFKRLGSVAKIRGEYVYPTSSELTFLREFLLALRRSAPSGQLDGVPMLPNPGVKTFVDELSKFQQANSSGSDTDFARDVAVGVADGDIKKLKDLKSQQVAALESQRTTLATNKTKDAQSRVANTLGRISLLKAALQAVPLEVGFVADLAEMSLADWQKRSVQPVAKDIEAVQQLLRVAEASQQPADVLRLRTTLRQLEMRKAAILGVLPEYQRRQAIADRLATEASAKDLKALREERDALDVAIAAAEPAKQKAKAAVADEPSVATYFAETGGAVLDNDGIIRLLGDDRPRYVIVVKSLEPASNQQPGGAKPAGAPPAGAAAAPVPKPAGVGDLSPPAAPVPPPVSAQPAATVEAAKDKKQ
jgi:hypothetical protein